MDAVAFPAGVAPGQRRVALEAHVVPEARLLPHECPCLRLRLERLGFSWTLARWIPTARTAASGGIRSGTAGVATIKTIAAGMTGAVTTDAGTTGAETTGAETTTDGTTATGIGTRIGTGMLGRTTARAATAPVVTTTRTTATATAAMSRTSGAIATMTTTPATAAIASTAAPSTEIRRSAASSARLGTGFYEPVMSIVQRNQASHFLLSQPFSAGRAHVFV